MYNHPAFANNSTESGVIIVNNDKNRKDQKNENKKNDNKNENKNENKD